MDVDGLIDELIAREGGYVARAEDRGGPTRFGITRATARRYGYAGDMARLPRATAAAIYRAEYWTGAGLDRVAEIAPRIAAELLDTGANMGPQAAARLLRRALNALNRGAADYPDLPADGGIDDGLIAALRAFAKVRGPGGGAVLLKAVDALQAERYVALAERRPANEAFLYGWLANRVG